MPTIKKYKPRAILKTLGKAKIKIPKIIERIAVIVKLIVSIFIFYLLSFIFV